MKVIYEPKGRAKEYSELACNWYMGCIHGCKYCFAPGCMRKKMEDWHASVLLRKDIISLFRHDAEEMQQNNDQRSILFSFLSDPYQPIEEKYKITRQILRIVRQYGLNSKVLTKGSYSLIRRDFDLLKTARVEFLGIRRNSDKFWRFNIQFPWMSASLTPVPIWYRVPKTLQNPHFFNQMVKN